MTKKELRSRLKQILRDMDPMSRYARSLAACKHLTSLPEFISADTVMLFLSMTDEIDTAAIAIASWRAGKTVLAPKTLWENRKLQPIEVQSLDTDITTGKNGVPEPKTGGTPFPIDMIDFIVMPGLAFDTEGHRLGRGGGFYDKLLNRPDCRATKCALAFSHQVVEQVPVEAHDAAVDIIATDESVIDCRKNR